MHKVEEQRKPSTATVCDIDAERGHPRINTSVHGPRGNQPRIKCTLSSNHCTEHKQATVNLKNTKYFLCTYDLHS